MRIVSRLVLVACLALLGSAVAAAPAHAQKPAMDCWDDQGIWYPNGWSGYRLGVWSYCENGFWYYGVS